MDVSVHTESAELYGGLIVVVRSASAELQVCYGCNRSERLGRDAVWYGCSRSDRLGRDAGDVWTIVHSVSAELKVGMDVAARTVSAELQVV